MTTVISRLLDAPWGHSIRRDNDGNSVVVLAHWRNGATIKVVAPDFDEAVTAALDQADDRWQHPRKSAVADLSPAARSRQERE
jgi:hypothetical protein